MKKTLGILGLLLIVAMAVTSSVEAKSYAQHQKERFSAGIERFSCYDTSEYRNNKNVPAISGYGLNEDYVECARYQSNSSMNQGWSDAFDATIDYLLEYFG